MALSALLPARRRAAEPVVEHEPTAAHTSGVSMTLEEGLLWLDRFDDVRLTKCKRTFSDSGKNWYCKVKTEARPGVTIEVESDFQLTPSAAMLECVERVRALGGT